MLHARVIPLVTVDPNAAREDELRARHQLVTVTGTSGAAIAYDYKPCQSIAVREVSIGGRRDVRCIARADTTLFAGVAGGGIAVLDIANPSATEIVATFSMPGSELSDFALVGTMLYAADYNTGVHAIDVSDPKQPRHVGMHPALTHSQNRRVVTSGDLLVLVNDHALSIFDIAKAGTLKPTAMHTRLRTAVGWLRGVVFESTRLHVTQGPMGVWTFDLADPANPRPISGLEPRLDTRADQKLICDALAHHGERLFVGTSSGIWALKLGTTLESEAFFTGPGTLRDNARGLVRDGALWFCACERSEEHTSELQSQSNLVCRLLLE